MANLKCDTTWVFNINLKGNIFFHFIKNAENSNLDQRGLYNQPVFVFVLYKQKIYTFMNYHYKEVTIQFFSVIEAHPYLDMLLVQLW